MNKKSAVVIAGGLVLALMAGTVSRELTLGKTAAVPVKIIVQTPAAAPLATAPAPGDRELA